MLGTGSGTGACVWAVSNAPLPQETALSPEAGDEPLEGEALGSLVAQPEALAGWGHGQAEGGSRQEQV